MGTDKRETLGASRALSATKFFSKLANACQSASIIAYIRANHSLRIHRVFPLYDRMFITKTKSLQGIVTVHACCVFQSNDAIVEVVKLEIDEFASLCGVFILIQTSGQVVLPWEPTFPSFLGKLSPIFLGIQEYK